MISFIVYVIFKFENLSEASKSWGCILFEIVVFFMKGFSLLPFLTNRRYKEKLIKGKDCTRSQLLVLFGDVYAILWKVASA